MSLTKHCYRCFRCSRSGNILDFTATMEGGSIREAAIHLAGAFGLDTGRLAPRDHKERAAPNDTKKETNEKSSGEESSTDQNTPPEDLPPLPANHVLTFALKHIDHTHLAVSDLGIGEETRKLFTLWHYRGRGLFRDRIIFPVHNRDGGLVAYGSYDSEQRTYTYPEKFNKTLELFNLYRAGVDVGDNRLILVEEPLEVMMLIEAGYRNTVALMDQVVSDTQIEILIRCLGERGKISLLVSKKMSSRSVVENISRLITLFFLRLVRYQSRQDCPTRLRPDDLHLHFS